MAYKIIIAGIKTDIICILVFTTAAELTWDDLITKKSWGEYGDHSISDLW